MEKQKEKQANSVLKHAIRHVKNEDNRKELLDTLKEFKVYLYEADGEFRTMYRGSFEKQPETIPVLLNLSEFAKQYEKVRSEKVLKKLVINNIEQGRTVQDIITSLEKENKKMEVINQ